MSNQGKFTRTEEIAEEALRRWKHYALDKVMNNEDPSVDFLFNKDNELSKIDALKKELRTIAARRTKAVNNKACGGVE